MVRPGDATKVVSTLDVLKFVAVALMIVDHVGLYFGDSNWLRVLGRPAAIIFGFLIGFSGSTRVPPAWIGLGLGLSLLEGWLFPQKLDRAMDILISLALTRIAMPFFEHLHARVPLGLAPAAVVLLLVAGPLNAFLEYATEVTVVALLGLAVRLDRGRSGHAAARDAVVLVALAGLSLIAIRHFELNGWQAAACVTVIAGTLLALARFQRRPVAVPQAAGPLLRFVGRNTLWIYALHLAALQFLAWWLLYSPEED